ncbi:MAG: hypothetical protein AB8H80_14630 [Planctomycetota bacterium]
MSGSAGDRPNEGPAYEGPAHEGPAHEAPGREDRLRAQFGDLDDTLADGPAPAEMPADAKLWLADQRVLHGLLRALHSADPAAREGRVAAILEGLDAKPGRSSGSTGYGRRHWPLVAAAALLLGSLGIWLSLPPSLPTAEAAMARAVDELARPLDRKFHIRISRIGRDGAQSVRQDFDLTTRPGMRFLIEGRFGLAGVRVGDGRIGCDGETLWVEPAIARFRRSAPLAESEQLLAGLGDLLDVGYLDVHAMVQRMPGASRLRVVERTVDDAGVATLRILARNRRLTDGGVLGGAVGNRAMVPAARPVRLRQAELLVEETSGMVLRVDAELVIRGAGRRRLEIDYRGAGAEGTIDYARPW